jgi:hypothetical protein
MKNWPELKILPNGVRAWHLNGKPHRQDGPAVERADGTREWWLNGELHRQDGPAVERADGTREWWLNGKQHREDGPAIEWQNGTCEWFLNGEEFKNSTRFLKSLEKAVSPKQFQEIKNLLEVREIMEM